MFSFSYKTLLMTKEEKIKIKKKVVEAFIALQTETISNFKAAMDEAQQAANDYGPPKDRYDSFRTQLLRKRDMLAQQVQKAYDDLHLLHKIDLNEIKNTIEFGSVVITNHSKLLIAAGIGKTKIGDEEYFAISIAVPIYNALKNCKKGESIIFNNKEYKILDLF